MSNKVINWLLFIILSVIWGSSFILMKWGMNGDLLSPYDVASIRIFSAGLVLLPFAVRAFKTIPISKWWVVILSGLLGSFFPAYLFCIAETRIDSALAGILNALTPLFTIIIGVGFFQLRASSKKWLGIILGFIALALIPFAANNSVSFKDFSYTFFVLLATVFYGVNVHLVGRYMKHIPSLHIAAMAFVFLMIPSLIILLINGYFYLPLSKPEYINATAASATLGIAGTAIASILFYMLLKQAGALFGSMVTYGIPFVAILWGLYYGESVTVLQFVCLGIILMGVYIANK